MRRTAVIGRARGIEVVKFEQSDRRFGGQWHLNPAICDRAAGRVKPIQAVRIVQTPPVGMCGICARFFESRIRRAA